MAQAQNHTVLGGERRTSSVMDFEINWVGWNYPCGEAIFATVAGAWESLARFIPPGSGSGTPSPGFGSGPGLWWTVPVQVGGPTIFCQWLAPFPVLLTLWIIHPTLHNQH